MLERAFSRRRFTLDLRVAVAIVAVALSQSFAFAQFSSPAVFGVYNRAAGMNGGAMGGGGASYGGANLGTSSYGPGPSSGYEFDSAGGGLSASGMQTLASFYSNEPTVVDTPEYIYKGHDAKEPILSVKFIMYNNGQEYKYALLTGSGDTTAHLIDLEGKYDPETTEWFMTSSRLRKNFKESHKQGITKAIFSPDYNYVLTSSYDEAGRLWTIGGAENIRAYRGAKDRLWGIDVSPSGEYTAGACNDGRVYFWQALQNASKLTFLPNRQDSVSKTPDSEVGHEGAVYDVAFDPTSSFVATAGQDGTVRIWNLGLLRQVSVLKGHKGPVYSVEFSEDGRYLLTASRDKSARIWDPASGEEVCRFVGHTGAVRQARFAGAYVCTASDDGTVRLWIPTSGVARTNNNDNGSLAGGPGMSTGSLAETTLSDPGAGSSYPGVGPSVGPGSSGAREGQNQGAKKPTRKPGRPKGIEYAIFETDSPVFSADVSEDSVYVCGGCADGQVKIWRMPGRARTYNTTQSMRQSGAGGFGLGMDPMGDSSNTLGAPVMGGDMPMPEPTMEK